MREINAKDLGNLVCQVIITTTNPLITGGAGYHGTGRNPCFGKNGQFSKSFLILLGGGLQYRYS